MFSTTFDRFILVAIQENIIIILYVKIYEMEHDDFYNSLYSGNRLHCYILNVSANASFGRQVSQIELSSLHRTLNRTKPFIYVRG